MTSCRCFHTRTQSHDVSRGTGTSYPLKGKQHNVALTSVVAFPMDNAIWSPQNMSTCNCPHNIRSFTFVLRNLGITFRNPILFFKKQVAINCLYLNNWPPVNLKHVLIMADWVGKRFIFGEFDVTSIKTLF